MLLSNHVHFCSCTDHDVFVCSSLIYCLSMSILHHGTFLTIAYEPGIPQLRQWDLANCRTVQFVLIKTLWLKYTAECSTLSFPYTWCLLVSAFRS